MPWRRWRPVVAVVLRVMVRLEGFGPGAVLEGPGVRSVVMIVVSRHFWLCFPLCAVLCSLWQDVKTKPGLSSILYTMRCCGAVTASSIAARRMFGFPYRKKCTTTSPPGPQLPRVPTRLCHNAADQTRAEIEAGTTCARLSHCWGRHATQLDRNFKFGGRATQWPRHAA